MVTNRAIRLIHDRVVDPNAFHELATQLHEGRLELRAALLQLTRGDQYFDVAAAMSALEWLAQSDANLALLLMAALYGLADKLFAHDVCDAIELWLEGSGDERLLPELQLHAERGSLDSVKAAEWITTITSRQSNDPAGDV
jgi:hypothetical protein